LDLETGRDTIIIRDGSSPKDQSIAELTGSLNENPRLVISTGNQLYVYFKTVLGDSKRGFKIKYSEGCRSTIFAANGTIASPAFGLASYPNNQECLYTLRRPGGGPLSLKFDDFEVHQSDFVQVKFGNHPKIHRIFINFYFV
jgi:CUB domain